MSSYATLYRSTSFLACSTGFTSATVRRYAGAIKALLMQLPLFNAIASKKKKVRVGQVVRFHIRDTKNAESELASLRARWKLERASLLSRLC